MGFGDGLGIAQLRLYQPQPRNTYKADVSVDTVNTHFGRTKDAVAALPKPLEAESNLWNAGHVVPLTPDHEVVLVTHDQHDESGTRYRRNPTTAGGGPTSQGTVPATHTPE
jgi:hypothetical protein